MHSTNLTLLVSTGTSLKKGNTNSFVRYIISVIDILLGKYMLFSAKLCNVKLRNFPRYLMESPFLCQILWTPNNQIFHFQYYAENQLTRTPN